MNHISQTYPEYAYLLEEKIQSLNFIEDKAYVIFIDGKNATKHHNNDMLSKYSYTYHLYDCGMKLIKELNIECHVFAIMDEISFIFPDGEELACRLNEDNEDCIVTLFTLMFYRKFKEYNDCLFKSCMYPIQREHIQSIIDFRRAVGKGTALTYYAKEYLTREERTSKSNEEIIQILKSKGLYEGYINNKHLNEGYYFCTCNSIIDAYLGIM